MTRLHAAFVAAAATPAFVLAGIAGAIGDPLDTYGIVANSEITYSGTVIINGNVALYDGTSITGAATVNGSTYTTTTSPAVAQQAQDDLTTLYNSLYPQIVTANLTGQDLAGQTLVGGVYNFDTSAGITTGGTLTLNGGGDPNSRFIFKIGTTLTTAASTNIVLINGANGANVYFVVGTSATLGADSFVNGNIIAADSISFGANVTITCGAALARNAAVTISNGATITSVGFNPLDTCGIVAAGDVLPDDTPDNTGDVGDALDGAGTLPPAFQAIIDSFVGSPAELAAALAQLSGEAGTGAAAAGGQSMNSFLSNLFDSTFADDSGGPGNTGPGDTRPGPGTVKALGYVSEDQVAAGPAVAALAPYAMVRDQSRWGVWASAYGGHATTDGDTSAGTHNLTSDNYGFAAGFGRDVSATTRVGFAFGGGSTTFGLSDGFGSGSSGIAQAAVYSRTNAGPAYIATALAYAYNSVSTSRRVFIPLATPPVDDTYTAAYSAHNVAAEIEAGYRLGWITPYAAVRVGAFFTPAYAESGAGDFGLAYDAHTTMSVRSELGARIARTFLLRDRATSFTVKARAAWAHDYLDSPTVSTSFQEIPDAPFNVSGAQPARDWLLLSAGGEFGFRNGFAIGGTFDSAFAENSQNWTGTGRISYRW